MRGDQISGTRRSREDKRGCSTTMDPGPFAVSAAPAAGLRRRRSGGPVNADDSVMRD